MRALPAFTALAAVDDLQWAAGNDDAVEVARAQHTLARLVVTAARRLTGQDHVLLGTARCQARWHIMCWSIAERRVVGDGGVLSRRGCPARLGLRGAASLLRRLGPGRSGR
jgi:hypothetical protein